MRFEHGDAVNSLEIKGDAPKVEQNPDENGFKKGTRVTFHHSNDTFKNVTEYDFEKLEQHYFWKQQKKSAMLKGIVLFPVLLILLYVVFTLILN